MLIGAMIVLSTYLVSIGIGLPIALHEVTKDREAKASLFNRVCQPKFAIKASDFKYLDVDIRTCKSTYKKQNGYIKKNSKKYSEPKREDWYLSK